MRLPFLTCRLPCRRLSGGRLREYELLRRVAGDVDLHVCAVSKAYDEDVDRAAELRRLGIDVEVFRARTDPADGVAPQVALHASRCSGATASYAVTPSASPSCAREAMPSLR